MPIKTVYRKIQLPLFSGVEIAIDRPISANIGKL